MDFFQERFISFLRLLDFAFQMLYLCISNKKTLMINLQKNYGK